MYTTQSGHEGERESRARHASSLECMQLWQCLSLCDAGSAHYCSYGSVFRGTPLLLLQVVLMNQVTTKVLDNNRGSKLVPALGEHALLYLIIAAQELLLFMHVIAHKTIDWLRLLCQCWLLCRRQLGPCSHKQSHPLLARADQTCILVQVTLAASKDCRVPCHC